MPSFHERGVGLMSRTTAIGYYHENLVALCERLTDHLAAPPEGLPRERMWRVRAGRVVLAQGAIERPLVFDGNDRPGVMLAGAARTYLNRFGVRVGDRAVVLTSHDAAWATAFELHDAGARVEAVVEVAARGGPRARGPRPRRAASPSTCRTPRPARAGACA